MSIDRASWIFALGLALGTSIALASPVDASRSPLASASVAPASLEASMRGITLSTTSPFASLSTLRVDRDWPAFTPPIVDLRDVDLRDVDLRDVDLRDLDNRARVTLLAGSAFDLVAPLVPIHLAASTESRSWADDIDTSVSLASTLLLLPLGLVAIGRRRGGAC